MFDNSLLNVVISTAIIYFFVIAGLRVLGKKELAQLSLTDLVLILLISNAVQNAMVGDDSSLLGGILAAATLFLLNKLFKYLIYKSDRFSKIMEGEPVILIRHGKLNHKQLKKNRLNIRQLEEACRENGMDDLKKVDLAILEVDGKISVISEENIEKGGDFDVDENDL